MCNFLRPQKHLKKGQLSDVSPMMCFTCCCWSSTFHNRRADNKQLEPSTRPARWVRRQQQQQQQGQQAPLCCQFKMIKQTNINPLQVDACGCRLMALSDSPATLEPIRCDPGIWDWDSESPRLWECATVSSPPCPISISSHSERHSHCHGLNAVPAQKCCHFSFWQIHGSPPTATIAQLFLDGHAEEQPGRRSASASASGFRLDLDSCPCSAVFRTLHATRISTRNLFLPLPSLPPP